MYPHASLKKCLQLLTPIQIWICSFLIFYTWKLFQKYGDSNGDSWEIQYYFEYNNIKLNLNPSKIFKKYLNKFFFNLNVIQSQLHSSRFGLQVNVMKYNQVRLSTTEQHQLRPLGIVVIVVIVRDICRNLCYCQNNKDFWIILFWEMIFGVKT